MSDSLAPANSDDDEVPDYLIAEVINVGEEEAGEEGDLDDSASTVGQSRLDTKRKRRRSKYEIVQASITESQTKLVKLEAVLEKAKAAKGYYGTDEKRKEAIGLAERKVKSQMLVLEAQLERERQCRYAAPRGDHGVSDGRGRGEGGAARVQTRDRP